MLVDETQKSREFASQLRNIGTAIRRQSESVGQKAQRSYSPVGSIENIKSFSKVKVIGKITDQMRRGLVLQTKKNSLLMKNHNGKLEEIAADIKKVQDRLEEVNNENMILKEELSDLNFVKQGNASAWDL